MQVEIIRSNRKSVSIQITQDEKVIVRAPSYLSQKKINEIVQEKADWIAGHIEKIRRNEKESVNREELSQEEIATWKRKAVEYIPLRVAYYAGQMGVTYGRISIRHQKTRWGSCSSKGNLNFNCLLMRAPEEVLDYVVVHELCHRREMNHSRAFWNEVEHYYPDYQMCRRWLKDHGHELNLKNQEN